VLIQRKQQFDEKTGKAISPELFITDPIQLAKKKVYVWDKSSYFDRLVNLQDEIGDTIFIRPTQSYQGVEELIEMVADGQVDFTVAEKNTALINEQFYDNIDASISMSFKQNIGFGLSKKSPLLKRRLDVWLKKFMQREAFSYIKGKYYDFSGNNIAFSEPSFKSKKGGVSPFDDIIKREAAKYGLDWRFALAIICHESSFNPNARGLGGAYGLMQLILPTCQLEDKKCTVKKLLTDPKYNIKIGNKIGKLFFILITLFIK
jgi:membrane-bound lytic murein transglycosylase F